MALQRAGSYQQASTSGTSTLFTPGTSRSHYDVNGNLTAITDDTKGENNRSFVNDISGKALQVSQSGNVQRQLVVGGEVLARYGVGIDEVNPRDANGNPNFAPIGTSSGGSVIGAIPGQVRNGADFNFGYQPLNSNHHGNYPTASAGSYQVATGDTLQTIAQGAYGDSSLWYRIADANGLSGNSDLRVGQTLTIPNRVGTVHNYGANSAVGGAGSTGSFKPYDPSKVQGDSTPNLPAPQAEGGGCGGLGQILIIIVAIVVTVYTAGAFAAASGGLTGAAAGATAAAAGGGAAGTFAAGVAALGGTYGAGVAVAAGVIGGIAGSVVSQGVGIAIGVQEDFSWKGVALAAIGGAVSGGLGASGAFSGLGAAGSVITRAAVGNALTQGIAVVTGLQDKFSWKGVAAAAVGAGVSYGVSEALSAANNGAGAFSSLGEVGGKLARASLTGFAAGLATAAARGGRVSITQVATDAFGQALGESFKDGLVSAGQQEMALRDAHSENQREANRFASGAATNLVNSPGAASHATALAQDELLGGGALRSRGLTASDSDQSIYSLAPQGARVSGLNPALSGEGLALRQGLRDEFDQRVLGGIANANAPEMTDADRFAQSLGLAYGDDYNLIPTAGSNTSNSGSGAGGMRPRPGSNQPLSLSTNGRSDSFFQAISELAEAGLVGNPTAQYKDDANILDRANNQKEIDRIRDKFGANARNAPEIGKAWDASGRILDDLSTNNVERFKSLEKVLNTINAGGAIEVDSRYNIVSLGKSKLSPDKFAAEFASRYQASFDEGYNTAVELNKQGLLKTNNSVDINVTYGQFGDKFARDRLRTYLNQEGLPDSRDGVVSVNRRLYGEGMSASFRIPDTALDFGVNKRLILDATVGIKGNNTPQVQDFRQGLYNTNVILVRPVTLGGPEILTNLRPSRR